jgi:hypothetical protein
MTEDALAHALAAYAAGLEAEISLLVQLDALSTSQRTASADTNIRALNALTDERERLLGHLVRVEHDLKPVRATIAAERARAARLPQFAAVSRRHHEAAELVSRIIAADEQTLAGLHEAETARRFIAQAIEAGGQTLAAYRKVVTPTVSSAALIDRRG